MAGSIAAQEVFIDSYREIENLLYRYAELIDAGDLEGVAQLFVGAEFLNAQGEVVAAGKAELLAMFQAAVKICPENGTPGTKHVTTNAIIEVDEISGEASVRSYFTVFQAVSGLSLQPIVAGRYRDHFTRDNGVWRFCRRCVIPELYGDVSKHLHYDPREI